MATTLSILEQVLADLDESDELVELVDLDTPSAPVEAKATRTPRKKASKADTKAAAKSNADALRDALEGLEPDIDLNGEAVVAGEVIPVKAAKPEPVIRPNGQKYYPRVLAGKTDVDALRDLRKENVPVLLSGYPGCGKTALIEAAFADEDGPITFAGHGEAEIGDLVGSYVQQPDGSYKWQMGPLPKAMMEGRPLFVDDATLTPSGVLARLYPVMDGRGVITLTEHEGETITAQPGFYVLGAHNPGVPGAVLSEALSSRFSVQLDVPTDLNLAARLGVEKAVITIARQMQAKRLSGEVLWAPEMRELLAYDRIKGILGRTAALENLISICPEADRDVFKPLLSKQLDNVRPLTLDEA
jgi:hypothetical protein